MSEIKTTNNLVKEILKTSQKARNSDSYLLYSVYATIGKREGIDIDNMSVPTFFLNLKKFGFPSPETVRRTRQKLQSEHPELRGCDEVEEMRDQREKEFRSYARKANV